MLLTPRVALNLSTKSSRYTNSDRMNLFRPVKLLGATSIARQNYEATRLRIFECCMSNGIQTYVKAN